MTEIEAGPGESRSLLRKRYEADFTFQPKISSNSQKLTENLATDFLTRQQHHIEKQKKHYEQALQSTEPLLDRPRRIRLSYGGSPQTQQQQQQQQQQANSDSSDDQQSSTGGGKNKKSRKQQASFLDTQQPGDIPRPSADDAIDSKKKRSRSLPPKANKKSQQDSVAAAAGDADAESDSGPVGGGGGGSSTRRRRSAGAVNDQRLRKAKELADQAMRDRRIFTILGPYPRVRDALRARGWVEKFYVKEEDKQQQQTVRRSLPGGKRSGVDDTAATGDDDDDGDGDGDADDMGDNDDGKVPPWEEEGGFYGLMSRLVRNCQPTLIWSLRKDQVDFKFLRRDQLVNHFGKAGCFTTKIGLCRSLRELPWFDCENADIFYPRCYVLSSEEEKEAFKDDYRITACMSLLRIVSEDASDELASATDDGPEEELSATAPASLETARSTVSGAGGPTSPKKTPAEGSPAKGHHKDAKKIAPKIQFKSPRPANNEMVAKSVLETAIAQCERLIQDRNHDNLDDWDPASCLSESDWYTFLQAFYRVAHYGARIRDSDSLKSRCRELCAALRSEYPQFDIDGYRNAWIVKPGAKSRGRGIFCVRTLESVMELVRQPSAVGVSANKLVVQKYIERPLLVHRTKFDIRQWFVVTDFNPLTIWWYKDCYVRFCSQHFTLNDFNEAVHLSNNSIQYKYINQPDRHPDLPDDNIWDCITLQTHLTTIGQPNVYYDVIYPGMQKAVINSMLCSQDHVEMRKNCFELYGADFMIDENFQPWLLEINCSPTMAPSTVVTTRLCRNVQDDIMKVIIDRRQDRTCDTGRFELIYKQQQVNAPTYAGVDLTLLGQSVKRPWNCSVSAPRPERSVSLFAEERRLDRERLTLSNQRGPAAPTPPDESSASGQSGSGAASAPTGHVTKAANPKLVSVANRKPPTRVEIIPINTGLPKKSSNQPTYFRSKTTSYIPGRPLGGFHSYQHQHQQQQLSIVEAYPPPPPSRPPLLIKSSGGNLTSSQTSRLNGPAAHQVIIAHRYSHRNL